MRPGILPEHGFKHKGNHYASLPWFGTKIAQKYAIKGSKYSGFRRDVKPHVLTFSTSGQCQVTTFCTCAVTSRKKCHVSGCRRQAGDVCCLRCLMSLYNVNKLYFLLAGEALVTTSEVDSFVHTEPSITVGQTPPNSSNGTLSRVSDQSRNGQHADEGKENYSSSHAFIVNYVISLASCCVRCFNLFSLYRNTH